MRGSGGSAQKRFLILPGPFHYVVIHKVPVTDINISHGNLNEAETLIKILRLIVSVNVKA